jgi:hypothetical protein
LVWDWTAGKKFGPVDRGWPTPGIKNMFVLKKVLFYKFYIYPFNDKLVKKLSFSDNLKIISRWNPGGLRQHIPNYRGT